MVGRQELGDGTAVVVADDRHRVESERVEQADHHRLLGGKRPVRAGRRLGIAQAEEVRGEATVTCGECGEDLAPHERRERAAVEEEQRGAFALFDVCDPGVADIDEALVHARKASSSFTPEPIGSGAAPGRGPM